MMTFKDYILQLNNFLEKHPEIADKPCVYVSDDEGNSYQFGAYEPSIKYVESSINLKKAYSLDCFEIVDMDDSEALVAIQEEYENKSLDEMLKSKKFQQRLVVCIN